MKRAVLLLIIVLAAQLLNAQKFAIVTGTITDSLDRPVDLANVVVLQSNTGTMTNADGRYRLEAPAGMKIELQFSCIGYLSDSRSISLEPGENKSVNITLQQDVRSIGEISVSARQDRASTFQRINVKDLEYMPTTSGRVETIIKSQAGVNSNNELSSQYSVRGGNFDENLVYVNDIEIYRPFLVKSGEQEGLSFINSDLVSSIRFSAGGFDAMYGDKMSSALDITYKQPEEIAAGASISLLGASVHFEGISENRKLTYLAGYRYKTTSYLLNTLETSGDYRPQFSDFQTLITYHFSRKVSVSFLGNYSSNKYNFVPETRNTSFGTYQQPINLKIYYDGQELDQFNTSLGALSFDYKPLNNVKLKFISNLFRTSEQETYDIRGQYWINELDNTFGSETFGDSILNLAVGTLHNHARNYLDAYVISFSHLGTWLTNNHTVKWGLKYKYQDFYDIIKEWELVDSAGYSIPYTGQQVSLVDYSSAKNEISYDQVSGFIQDTWEFNTANSDYFLTVGVRGTLWRFNKTFMTSPRITLSMQPYWEKDMMFHLSGGYYYQPPFYKEMRMLDETINHEIIPQRSIHILMGGDYLFTAWERSFKLTAEMYYKWLNNLIPYKIENVRIRYAGENIATGYAKGLDLKLNGEFVPGTQSWFTASLMRTRENIMGDSIRVWQEETEDFTIEEAGEYSRPTDQIFTAGVYFQDYLPNNPDYKVQLSAFFGTGLPLSYPDKDRYYTKFKMLPYRRVDLGFSKSLVRPGQTSSKENIFRYFKSVWISAEIFNLLGIKNQASATWIRTLSNQSGVSEVYSVPNYLTGRRFNLKITADF